MSYVASHQDPFRAISDPGRRRMLDAMLSREYSVTELTALVGISQPAVSQHLRVLKFASLVDERQQGRQSLYRARPAELQIVFDWLAKYETFWNEKLNALDAHLARKMN
jgi:DNA-binding transcriptional ArsR family regulator